MRKPKLKFSRYPSYDFTQNKKPLYAWTVGIKQKKKLQTYIGDVYKLPSGKFTAVQLGAILTGNPEFNSRELAAQYLYEIHVADCI